MKSKILSATLIILGTSITTISIIAQPSYGSDKPFSCDDEKTLSVNPPHTRNIPIIQFKSATFNNWRNQYNRNEKYKPRTRCKVVEQKLQLYFDCKNSSNPKDVSKNPLDSLKAEVLLRQEKRLKRYYPYIAITPDSPESRKCLEAIVDPSPKIPGLLFMLPPVNNKEQAEANAQNALERLEEIRSFAFGDPIEN